jgi:hypothetical protein
MTRFSVSQQTKSLATCKQESKKDLEERGRGTNQGLDNRKKEGKSLERE